MATHYPTSPSRMNLIYGMGSQKLAKYGQVFIDEISAYCIEHQINDKRNPITEKTEGRSSNERQPRHILVGDAYNAGASIQELMDRFRVQEQTILNHLTNYQLEGNVLRSDEFITVPNLAEDLRQKVMQAFELLGAANLKPIYDMLDGVVNYDELKRLRLYYLVNKSRIPTTNDDVNRRVLFSPFSYLILGLL